MTEPARDMVDWDFAVRLGAKLAGNGPAVGRAEGEAVVAELRADAARATGLVRGFTGLDAPEDTAPVLVVDRAGWVRANADAFAHVLAPIVDSLTQKKPPTGVTRAVGAKITGAEVGGLLGFLSGKVLGQFDPFHDPHGRLLLVAPNVVHVERELSVDPTDFRLWVCLHEETHRVQFTAVPWLRDHLFGEVRALADTMDLPTLLDDGLPRAIEAIKGKGNLLEAVSSPEQRAIMDRVTGVMSLLEGHADVVMDDVGPSVIPTVATIREAFNRRRKGVGTLDRILRRLLGLEQKMAQYRDGAGFVRGVVDKVGMAEFNAVFAAPENLPSKEEIHHPKRWIKRVL
jgi:coenzyme F420 biosynthesis associated uncharacterized protein